MQHRQLGPSDLEVSVLAFGAWQLGDAAYWGEVRQGDAAVRAAIDAGINLFDVAEVYGDGGSERALGRALGKDRDRVLIAGKVGERNLGADQVRQACEGSLRRLGTDRIDLYQVHWPSTRGVPFAETYEALARLREEGKVRQIGISNFGVQDIEHWCEVGTAVSHQLGLNLVFRAAEDQVLPACRQHGMSVLTYMPLMQGILANRWRSVEAIPAARRRTRHFSSDREGVRHGESGHENLLMETVAALAAFADETGTPLPTLAMAWILTRPAVTSIIAGASRPDQVARNVAAVAVTLDAGVVAQLDRITLPLKKAMGSSIDMWEGAAKSRSH